MFLSLLLSLSIFFVCLFVSVSVSLLVGLSISRLVGRSVSPSVCQSVGLLVCKSVDLSVCQSVGRTVYPSDCLWVGWLFFFVYSPVCCPLGSCNNSCSF